MRFICNSFSCWLWSKIQCVKFFMIDFLLNPMLLLLSIWTSSPQSCVSSTSALDGLGYNGFSVKGAHESYRFVSYGFEINQEIWLILIHSEIDLFSLSAVYNRLLLKVYIPYNGGSWKTHSKNWADTLEKVLSWVSRPGSTHLPFFFFLLSIIFQLG